MNYNKGPIDLKVLKIEKHSEEQLVEVGFIKNFDFPVEGHYIFSHQDLQEIFYFKLSGNKDQDLLYILDKAIHPTRDKPQQQTI
ncbi:hypothetical protein HQ529_05770 [Candidatus Woesearchaeota archaeon]|nr:hypothetical protein [Candidatus Woesearchaeota archaeon]